MQTQVTLTLDSAVLRRLREQADRSGKSLSEVVESLVVPDYSGTGKSSGVGRDAVAADLTHRVRELWGCLRGAEADEEDYRGHLERKYR